MLLSLGRMEGGLSELRVLKYASSVPSKRLDQQKRPQKGNLNERNAMDTIKI